MKKFILLLITLLATFSMAFAEAKKEQLKKTLTEMQYKVTQEAATEPPFKN